MPIIENIGRPRYLRLFFLKHKNDPNIVPPIKIYPRINEPAKRIVLPARSVEYSVKADSIVEKIASTCSEE
jgi:hypothetical protein